MFHKVCLRLATFSLVSLSSAWATPPVGSCPDTTPPSTPVRLRAMTPPSQKAGHSAAKRRHMIPQKVLRGPDTEDANFFNEVTAFDLAAQFPEVDHPVSEEAWAQYLEGEATTTEILSKVQEQEDFKAAAPFFRLRTETPEACLYRTIKALVPQWIKRMATNFDYFFVVEGLDPLTRRLEGIINPPNPHS